MATYVIGEDLLKATLARAPQRAMSALSKALYAEGHKVMGLSKKQYVPVDKGVLRASGTVKKPVISTTKVLVTLGYGGAAKAYAVVQHENLGLHHPPKNARKRYTKKGNVKRAGRAGTAKYLSIPMMEMSAEMPFRLALACDRMFKSQGL